uniref:Cytochrome b559 alpha subunit of photosystem II n=1 Tax=Pyrocystis lunula TaxID=2972 RepID=A0A2R4QHC7_PYRLU|nr:cytochrome b559 alpha subunit of photosystem II [Pyrocystis lunula]
MSSGERPFLDIIQDRRYWLVHLVSIPSLFIAGAILVSTGFAYRVFGTPNTEDYFNTSTTSLLNDRFTISLAI